MSSDFKFSFPLPNSDRFKLMTNGCRYFISLVECPILPKLAMRSMHLRRSAAAEENEIAHSEFKFAQHTCGFINSYTAVSCKSPRPECAFYVFNSYDHMKIACMWGLFASKIHEVPRTQANSNSPPPQDCMTKTNLIFVCKWQNHKI